MQKFWTKMGKNQVVDYFCKKCGNIFRDEQSDKYPDSKFSCPTCSTQMKRVVPKTTTAEAFRNKTYKRWKMTQNIEKEVWIEFLKELDQKSRKEMLSPDLFKMIKEILLECTNHEIDGENYISLDESINEINRLFISINKEDQGVVPKDDN